MKRRVRRIKRTFTELDHTLWRKVMDEYRSMRPYREIDLTEALAREQAERESCRTRVYWERTYRIEDLPQEDKERLGLG